MTAANVGFLTKKGDYPYDYVSSIDKFSERVQSQLPPKSEFYSKLNDEDISDEDYQHAQNVSFVQPFGRCIQNEKHAVM